MTRESSDSQKSCENLFDEIFPILPGETRKECKICSRPGYIGQFDTYYEYEYCPNCGKILSEPCGDAITDYDDDEIY